MRLMTIHADRFSFAVTGKTSVAGFVGDLAQSEERVEEALVAFVAVEKLDESDAMGVAEQAVAHVATTAAEVAANRVVVYPYAHLSSDLASPRTAVRVLDRIAERLRASSGLDVRQAPFGYYKAFDIACKGHPLSEKLATENGVYLVKVGNVSSSARGGRSAFITPWGIEQEASDAVEDAVMTIDFDMQKLREYRKSLKK